MPPVIRLPRLDGALEPYTVRQAVEWGGGAGRIGSRIAYAAAHVGSAPHATCAPLSGAGLDWDATLGSRRYLWSLGLAVAEAMDTAQRGTGLGWPAARDLIRRSLAEARATGGMIACGAGTDQLTPGERVTLDDVEQAYEEQVGYVERHGGRVILMASRALARAARPPRDHRRGYGAILRQGSRTRLPHWRRDMFDPQLPGCWGARGLHH